MNHSATKMSTVNTHLNVLCILPAIKIHGVLLIGVDLLIFATWNIFKSGKFSPLLIADIVSVLPYFHSNHRSHCSIEYLRCEVLTSHDPYYHTDGSFWVLAQSVKNDVTWTESIPRIIPDMAKILLASCPVDRVCIIMGFVARFTNDASQTI